MTQPPAAGTHAVIDRSRLTELIRRERDDCAGRPPSPHQAFAAADKSLLDGVPMTWMMAYPGGFPAYVATARGARLTDIDGSESIDLCLGDTGAMAGHSPGPVREAVARLYGEL